MADLTLEELSERGIPAIRRILDFGEQEFSIPHGGDVRAPVVAYGLFMSLAHQVLALLLLREKNLDHACAPLRRSVIEHTAFLVWLADEGEKAVDAMNHGLQFTLEKKLQPAAEKAGIAQDEETQRVLAATLAEVLPQAETDLLHASKLIDQYLGATLAAAWHAESGFGHPSLQVVRLFVEEDEEGNIKLHDLVRHDLSGETVIVCLYGVFLGALALNSLMEEPVWEETLCEIGEDLGMPMELPKRK